MKMIEDVVLNLILMMFPILVFFIYNCYRELKCEKYNHLLLDVALVTSMYLCFRYGNVKDNTLALLFCNLPIVVAYLKNQPNVSVLLSSIVVMYGYFVFEMDITFLVLKFICYYLLYIVGKKKKIKDNKFILLIAVLQGFFLSFEYFYTFHQSNIIT